MEPISKVLELSSNTLSDLVFFLIILCAVLVVITYLVSKNNKSLVEQLEQYNTSFSNISNELSIIRSHLETILTIASHIYEPHKTDLKENNK